MQTKNPIYLIYTPTKTNESGHVPTKGNHLGGIQAEPTRASKEQALSGSPLRTRALSDKKKGISRLDEEKTAPASSRTLPPNPHTRSKIIPL